jgi:hypothetical protein
VTGGGALMLQFGTQANNSTTYYEISFPTPFPNNCFGIVAMGGNGNPEAFSFSSLSKTGVNLTISPGSTTSSDGIPWLAWGN